MALPVISCTTYDTSVYRTLLYARSSNLFTMTVSGLSLAACSIASRTPRLRDSEIKILQHSSTDCSMVFFLSFCKRSQHSSKTIQAIQLRLITMIYESLLTTKWGLFNLFALNQKNKKKVISLSFRPYVINIC